MQSEAFFQHLAELTVALEGTYGDEGSAIQQAGHDIIERVAARQIVTIREGDGIVDRTAPERR